MDMADPCDFIVGQIMKLVKSQVHEVIDILQDS